MKHENVKVKVLDEKTKKEKEIIECRYKFNRPNQF